MPHIISGLHCVLLLFLVFLWFCYLLLANLVFLLRFFVFWRFGARMCILGLGPLFV